MTAPMLTGAFSETDIDPCAHGDRVTRTGGRARRVLVVDDEASVCAFAERALTSAGYDVALAADGPEALRVADEQAPFDVFVIDLMMPLMKGDELARRLRQREPEARILYFTGYSDQLFEDRRVLGAHEAFLEKPVTINGLLEAVSLLLDASSD